MFDDFSAFGKKSLISRIGYFSSKISREFAGIAGNPRSLPDVSVLCRKVRNCAAISQKLDGQEDRLVIACKKSPPTSLRRISRIKNPRTALSSAVLKQAGDFYRVVTADDFVPEGVDFLH